MRHSQPVPSILPQDWRRKKRDPRDALLLILRIGTGHRHGRGAGFPREAPGGLSHWSGEVGAVGGVEGKRWSHEPLDDLGHRSPIGVPVNPRWSKLTPSEN